MARAVVAGAQAESHRPVVARCSARHANPAVVHAVGLCAQLGLHLDVRETAAATAVAGGGPLLERAQEDKPAARLDPSRAVAIVQGLGPALAAAWHGESSPDEERATGQRETQVAPPLCLPVVMARQKMAALGAGKAAALLEGFPLLRAVAKAALAPARPAVPLCVVMLPGLAFRLAMARTEQEGVCPVEGPLAVVRRLLVSVHELRPRT